MDPNKTAKLKRLIFAQRLKSFGIPALGGLAFLVLLAVLYVVLNLPEEVTGKTTVQAIVTEAFRRDGHLGPGYMFMTVKLPDGQTIVVRQSAVHPPMPGEIVTLQRIEYESGKVRYSLLSRPTSGQDAY